MFSLRPVITLAIVFAVLFSPQLLCEEKDVRLGVLAYNGKARALQRWQATADYLSARIPHHRFVVVPLSLEEFQHAINKRELDFFLTNSGHYVQLEVQAGATRLATFRSRAGGKALDYFSAVLFTRKDSDIFNLQDLRGGYFAAVGPHAFGGYQLAALEFHKAGMELGDNVQLQWLGFPHSDIAKSVMSGRADAGIVRAGVLEALADEGILRLDEVRILDERQHDGFPYLHSTELFPEWPFARLPHVDAGLARSVTLALLSMPHDHHAALEAESAGWTIPLDYAPIHNVFRELKLPPYAPEKLDLAELIRAYGPWLAFVGVLMLTSMALLWRLFGVNRRLHHTQGELLHQQQQLEATVATRTEELLRVNRSLQDDISCRLEAERSLQSACDTLKKFHELATHTELSHEGKLHSMLGLVREFFGADYAKIVLPRDDGKWRVVASVPDAAEALAIDETQLRESLEAVKTIVSEEADTETAHVVCPVVLSDCAPTLVLMSLPIGKDTPGQPDSDIRLRVLHLFALWMANERALAETDERWQALKTKLSNISPREEQVLRLLVQGAATKVIARELNISTKTVELHRANLLKKTGAKSTLELVSSAAQAGFVS